MKYFPTVGLFLLVLFSWRQSMKAQSCYFITTEHFDTKLIWPIIFSFCYSQQKDTHSYPRTRPETQQVRSAYATWTIGKVQSIISPIRLEHNCRWEQSSTWLFSYQSKLSRLYTSAATQRLIGPKFTKILFLVKNYSWSVNEQKSGFLIFPFLEVGYVLDEIVKSWFGVKSIFRFLSKVIRSNVVRSCAVVL